MKVWYVPTEDAFYLSIENEVHTPLKIQITYDQNVLMPYSASAEMKFITSRYFLEYSLSNTKNCYRWEHLYEIDGRFTIIQIRVHRLYIATSVSDIKLQLLKDKL